MKLRRKERVEFSDMDFWLAMAKVWIEKGYMDEQGVVKAFPFPMGTDQGSGAGEGWGGVPDQDRG